jgi:tRNA1(Val) A37 N6-methylase TrmN6
MARGRETVAPVTGGDDNGAKVSRNSFHRGGFEALQPVGFGHRAGSDALLLAASLPQGASGALADLGAGAGVAGLAALAVNPGLHAVLVEIDPVMADIARRNLSLEPNAAISRRAEVLLADATLTGRQRERAGLMPDSFEFVIMNPPYNDDRHRPPADPRKALAHMMGTGGLEPWMRTAAAILRPGGALHLVYRTDRLGDVIASSQGRFGGLSIMALHSKRNEPASRVIVRAVRGSRAPLRIYPGITLHGDNGAQTAEAEAALNGRSRLFPQDRAR